MSMSMVLFLTGKSFFPPRKSLSIQIVMFSFSFSHFSHKMGDSDEFKLEIVKKDT